MKTIISILVLSLISFGSANASLICLSDKRQLNELTVQIDFKNNAVRVLGDLFYKKSLMLDFLNVELARDEDGTIQFTGEALNQTAKDNSRFAVRGQLSSANLLVLDLGDYGVSTMTTTLLNCEAEQTVTIQ